jgi:hypothetical protein
MYFLPEEAEVIIPTGPERYVPAFKPLQASEAKRKQFQDGCESIRRNV